MKTLLLFITLSAITLLAQEASYTITGEKDPRLDALYMVTYVSQNLEDDKCSYKVKNLGYRRPHILSRNIAVPDGNYTIDLPITLTEDENNCNYRFNGMLLIMKRKYDEELSSIHYILSDKQKVQPIYYKTWRGSMSIKKPDTPTVLSTDKKYFRIAPKSTFLCKTKWYPKTRNYEASANFHCTMQIDDDVNRSEYKFLKYSYTHPSFGVENIEDTDMKIDILVDEKGSTRLGDTGTVPDHFRELEPSIWQKLF